MIEKSKKFKQTKLKAIYEIADIEKLENINQSLMLSYV